MFKAVDRTGQEIFMKDKVSYIVQDSMGAEDIATGYIIGIPSEELVQVQPDQGGTPEIVKADSLEVTDSLVQDVAALSDHEAFQAMLKETESRHLRLCLRRRSPVIWMQ
jgi:hypothetical protein